MPALLLGHHSVPAHIAHKYATTFPLIERVISRLELACLEQGRSVFSGELVEC
jgi:hypothetical protein